MIVALVVKTNDVYVVCVAEPVGYRLAVAHLPATAGDHAPGS